MRRNFRIAGVETRPAAPALFRPRNVLPADETGTVNATRMAKLDPVQAAMHRRVVADRKSIYPTNIMPEIALSSPRANFSLLPNPRDCNRDRRAAIQLTISR